MPDLKYTLPGTETVTLAGQTIDKLLRAGDGDAALLYLYILKTHGKSITAEAETALGKTPGDIAAAMSILSRLGLVRLEGDAQGTANEATAGADAGADTGAPEDESNKYTVEDMKRELETGSVFYSLVEEAQRSLGKIMSPDELTRLFGIYDSLRMAPEVILQLITHCITESRGRSSGRMPSMSYIEKAAYTWEREGIFSLDKAEEYIKALETRKSARGEIKRALQIRDRELSKTEKRYVDKWIGMGFTADAVEIAYDRTIMNTGDRAWPYMDSIITNWHGRNLRTPQEINDKDRCTGINDASRAVKGAGQKFGSAKREDIERMTRLLEKIKEE